MSALATRVEKEAGRPLTPLEIFDITAARESSLSRLLMLYISTGVRRRTTKRDRGWAAIPEILGATSR